MPRGVGARLLLTNSELSVCRSGGRSAGRASEVSAPVVERCARQGNAVVRKGLDDPSEEARGVAIKVVGGHDQERPSLQAQIVAPDLVELPLLIGVVPTAVVLDGEPCFPEAQVEAITESSVGVSEVDVDLGFGQAGEGEEEAKSGLGCGVDTFPHQSGRELRFAPALVLPCVGECHQFWWTEAVLAYQRVTEGDELNSRRDTGQVSEGLEWCRDGQAMPLDRVKLVAVPVQSDSGNAHLVIALQRQVQFWIVGGRSSPQPPGRPVANHGAARSQQQRRSTSDDDGVRNLGVNSDAAEDAPIARAAKVAGPDSETGRVSDEERMVGFKGIGHEVSLAVGVGQQSRFPQGAAGGLTESSLLVRRCRAGMRGRRQWADRKLTIGENGLTRRSPGVRRGGRSGHPGPWS